MNSQIFPINKKYSKQRISPCEVGELEMAVYWRRLLEIEGVIGVAVYYKKAWFVGLVEDGIVEFMSVRVKAWWWCFFILGGDREDLCVWRKISKGKRRRKWWRRIEETDVWMRKKKEKKKEKKNRFWVGLHDRWNTCTQLLF